jgi:hypothetical protein
MAVSKKVVTGKTTPVKVDVARLTKELAAIK